MAADRTTKVILAFIAVGLWANLLLPLNKPAHAVGGALEMYVAAIYNGTCINHKIC